ncbi:MAG: exosortase-associated EpsI family protein [Victivallaceae bacterium]|nr:exosortase-associated EpsI family protein [Victivallaceae bacterium]
MNCRNKIALFWCCSLFSVIRLDYLVRSWLDSPLERYNWGFLLLFLAMLGVARLNGFKSNEPLSAEALTAAVPSAVLCCGGLIVNINAAVIAGGIMLWWSSAWLLGGWRTGWRFLPAFTVLLLVIPGVGYRIGALFGLDPWGAKLPVAAAALIWQFTVWRWRWIVGPEFLLFCLAGGGAVAGYWCGGVSWRSYPEVRPDFSGVSAPEYFGREIDPDAADRRFFAGSTVRRYYFAAPDGEGIDVLDVAGIADVHQIHPAGYCLRSGGFGVETDDLAEIRLSGRVFQVNSLTASGRGRRILVWAWYERPGVSTGSFMRFRRGGDADGWRSILLSTAIDGHEGKAAAEKRLADFAARIAGALKTDNKD